MVTGVSEQLSADVALSRRIQPTYGYYRQPNGWITFSTITRLEKLKYVEQGWESLDVYGTFDASPYVLAHPFEALFMFGGAHEMPVDQLTQTGLYMDPPLVPTCRLHLTQFHRRHTRACWNGAEPVEFPQLEGLDLEPSPCGLCERVLPTVEAKVQHQSVVHKEALGNLQTGKSLGESLAEALGNVAPGSPARVEEDGPTREELQTEIGALRKDLAGYIEANPPAETEDGPSRAELQAEINDLKETFEKLTAPSKPATSKK